MPFIPNPNVFPPDGYQFIDADGVKHVGTNWPTLATAVREYRIRNGKPVGNVVAEINEQVCDKYPQICREAKTVFVHKQPPAAESVSTKLSSAVHRWFYLVLRAVGENPIGLVSAEEAQRRAEICMKCPRQASWTGNCGQCAGAAFRLAVSIRQGKDVKNADQLMGCSVLGEDTRTSAWLPRLKPATDENLPAKCWRKAP